MRSILTLTADERLKNVCFSDDTMTLDLMDGRNITVHLAWYPKLFNAGKEEREKWKASGGGYGIHWEVINENLNTKGLLKGLRLKTTEKDHRENMNAESLLKVIPKITQSLA